MMNFPLFLVFIFNTHLIPIKAGISCFGCNEVKSCEKFWNSTNEERKKNFTLNCGKGATGCMRGYKFKDFTNDTVLELEILQCYEPDLNPHRRAVLKMNECTQISETEWKRTYCVCDSGDYCIVKEEKEGTGIRHSPGILSLILVAFIHTLSLLRWI